MDHTIHFPLVREVTCPTSFNQDHTSASNFEENGVDLDDLDTPRGSEDEED